MAIRNSRPLKWTPSGISDALDGGNAFPGAMTQLANLIPDPTTKGLFMCRPAAVALAGFPPSPAITAFISASLVVGNQIYFMAGISGGVDRPYCYDLSANAFVAVSGVVPSGGGANCPTSQLSTGAWTPPIMKLVGTRIVVTHPGFSAASGNYVGWINISTPSAPAWSAGNTATNVLPSVPTGVAQFGGRAYYICGNALNASDSGNPLVITNATQVLTIGDSTAVTALAQLPLATTSGGVVQSLIAFKGAVTMYQITGDFATSTWAVNQLNVATGTDAPLSICDTPAGIAFISPDGLRLIDYGANVSEPIGDGGDGITNPFINAVTPSRIVGASTADTLRFSVQNNVAAGTPWQEYWFDFSRKIWTGPHTCAAAAIQPWGSTFVMAPQFDTIALYTSAAYPSALAIFTEDGATLTWDFQTVLLPDSGGMNENCLNETAVMMQLPAQQQVDCSFQDEDGTVLNSVSLFNSASAGPVWGSFTWGAATWGSTSVLKQRQIPWEKPLVFKQGSLLLHGNSSGQVRIGNLYMRFEQLGYLLQDTGT
ncbi:MAG: hypothetical protein AABZ67_00600 [Pseudomonadota bacterium]